MGVAYNAAHITVLEPGREVAAVVAGEGTPQRGLRSVFRASAFEAFAQHHLHGLEILATVETIGDRHAEPFQVVHVDLREADAEVAALRAQRFSSRERLWKAARLTFQLCTDNTDGVGIQRALGRCDRLRGAGVHKWCADRGEGDERRHVHVAQLCAIEKFMRTNLGAWRLKCALK